MEKILKELQKTLEELRKTELRLITRVDTICCYMKIIYYIDGLYRLEC